MSLFIPISFIIWCIFFKKMLKIFALTLCVAVVAAAPQTEVEENDFELRKWIFVFVFSFLSFFYVSTL